MENRLQERVPLALEVEYRTASAFLVAFSANLSSGGVFVETDRPLPIGTDLALRFNVPGTGPLEVMGVVAWTRLPGEEAPPGMGIRFIEPVDAHYGDIIDDLVTSFHGLRVIVMAAGPTARSQLARAVRSILTTAEIVEAADSAAAESALAHDADLVVLHLHDGDAEGLLTLRLAKVGARRAIPVLATTRAEGMSDRAHELGADEVLEHPPAAADLQAAILRALGRPCRVGL